MPIKHQRDSSAVEKAEGPCCPNAVPENWDTGSPFSHGPPNFMTWMDWCRWVWMGWNCVSGRGAPTPTGTSILIM